MPKNLVRNGKLYLYGPVGGSWWDDTGFTDEDVIEALAGLSGDITVHLNSPGGSVFEGVAIHTALNDHDGQVTIQVDALAASAASVIACAADTLIMTPGAQFMIHDPSSITWGDADAHRKTAAQLDSISRSSAKIYAAKSGLSEDECLAMMADETWFDADLAIEKGFADRVSGRDDKAPSATMSAEFPAFDYSVFTHAPAAVMSASVPIKPKDRGNPAPVKPAASAVQPKEPSMTKPNTPEPTVVAPKTPRMSADEFMTFAEKNNLTAAQMNAIRKKARPADAGDDEVDALDPVMVRDEVLAMKEKAQPDPVNNHPALVTEDARDKFKKGASLALQKRCGMGGEQNEYTGMRLDRLAEESLRMANIKVPPSREQMGLAALNVGPRMAHSTSDFPEILADVANKSLLKGHEEVEESFPKFTSEGTLTDFKPTKRVDLSTLPGLDEVVENGEYKDVTFGDRAETIRLKKYGNKVSITWETLVNDDLDALSSTPRKMGRAARRTVGDVVFSIFTNNPLMGDGTALFHASHANLLTGGASALSAASLSALRQKMALQKDGEAVLNIKPSILLVPVALEDDARILIASEFAPGETQRVPNKVRNMVSDVISDARLDAASATAFYALAAPMSFDTIEVAYLDGNSVPQMFQREGFDRDGIELKIRHVFGVAPMSWRTMAKSAGA